ncbi:YdeI/OmpD-associated family protein [Angustibacter sp. McL0619]|uniref:YdeI/OmpD-associated family protein n=1 Tax=Angustibacter sp. McL0619 TaxID=3415676 RepID=UPI003CF9DABC
MATYRTVLVLNGNNVGIDVPEDVVVGLGRGRTPPVVVTLNGYTYRSTVAPMGGRFLIPLAATHRDSAGVAGGEEHEVTVELDDQPRTVDVPDDLARALDDAGLRAAFDALAYTHRKEHVRSVLEAKAAATRERRIARVVVALG